MMNGRGYTGSGFSENVRCFGNGFMHNGVGMMIVIGTLLIIALLVFIFVHSRNKKVSKNSLVEVLKMK